MVQDNLNNPGQGPGGPRVYFAIPGRPLAPSASS
ncbi:MAG: hypothetical protein CM15mP18_0630 [Methanobacteriota archaeon]|nr:MAG: hypothetical protein CM15mP18_0630 [Euryarchaeota archaeon]